MPLELAEVHRLFAKQLCLALRRQLSHSIFPFSFYTSKSQLLCNSFTPRIKLAGRKVGIFLPCLVASLPDAFPQMGPSLPSKHSNSCDVGSLVEDSEGKAVMVVVGL